MTEIEQLRQNFEKLKPKHKYEKKFKATYDYKMNNPGIPVVIIILCIASFAFCISVAFIPDKMMDMALKLAMVLKLTMVVLILVPIIQHSITFYRYKNINNSSKNIIAYGESSIIDILFIQCHDSSYKGYKPNSNDPLSDWIITDIFMKYVVETPETIRLLNLKQLPNDIKSDLVYNILKDLNEILDELIDLNNKSIKNAKIIISDSSIQKSMAELNNLK